jgi:hypothetical protein
MKTTYYNKGDNMSINIEDIKDDRQFRALTGVSRDEFDALLPIFDESHHEIINENYENKKEERQRKPGGGSQGVLDTMEKRMFFILYYMKTYPTFDVLGFQFGFDKSNACLNVHKYAPVLYRTLEKLEVMPRRAFSSVEDMREAFAGIEDIFIDVTERTHARPVDKKKQKESYSGKKKHHAAKNTVISDINKLILFIGYTVMGGIHDYRLLKQDFPPGMDWFITFRLWVDLGYIGIQKDYNHCEILISHKKPRKSKANPTPSLTDEQKTENREMSSLRVIVEHAIGGIKRFGILTGKFRNRKEKFVDDVAALCAGLWNLKIKGIA